MALSNVRIILLSIWTITIFIVIETSSLPLLVDYQPYTDLNHKQDENPKWISDCRSKRLDPEVQIIHRDVKITPGGCIESKEYPLLRRYKGNIGQRFGHVCKGKTFTIAGQLLDHWSLSLLVKIECISSYVMELLTWQDISIQVMCKESSQPSLHVTGSDERLVYSPERSVQTHILIKQSSHGQRDGQTRDSLAVYINGSYVKPQANETIDKSHSTTAKMNPATLMLGSDEERRVHKPGGVILGALDLFEKALSAEEIKQESQFMYLRSSNTDYPECLCNELSPNGTVSCLNGEDRLRGKYHDMAFLPLRAVMDGMINPGVTYGFWPARLKDIIIYLKLTGPTWLSRIEIYMFSQPVTVFKDRCDCGKWHPLFCPSGQGLTERPSLCFETSSRNVSRNYRWGQVEGRSVPKLTWQAEPGISVVRSLKIEFEGGPDQDISQYTEGLGRVNPIYEIKVFGSVLNDASFPDSISCFPGNGNCHQRRCRDGKTSSVGKCKPYIDSLVPDYGPVSGGTVLMFSGGLLQPAVHQIHHEPNTTILGDRDIPLCDNIQRTDEFITCTTISSIDDEPMGMPQPLKVNILIDGALYRIDSQIRFTYKPDPIIEDITPYKSFLNETHRITVKGKHLDSIFIRPEQRVMSISLERKLQSKYKAPCIVESRETMVCILPAIKDTIVVKAHLGLTLDGVTRYKDLSAALHKTKPMMIYQKPQFTQKAIIELKRDVSELKLKGDMINTGFSADEYTVTIGESECEVVKIDYHSLSCKPQHGKLTDGKLVVHLYDITYDIGYVDYADQPINGAGIAIIISVTVVVLVFILVAVGLIIIWWRRKIYHRELRDLDVVKELIEQKTTPDTSGPCLPSITRPYSEELKDIMDGIELDSKNLEIREEIGCGNSGKVYHGNLSQGKYTKEVAVKTLKDRQEMDSATLNEFLKEATIMKGFSHPHVLSLLGITIEDGRAFVVLPYMEHGDLRGFVQNSRFEEVRFTKLVYDVSKGMNYLAEQKFVHRDLAARNCMVDTSENVLIGDFGLARDIHENDYYRPKDRSQPLPYKWMALESIEDVSFSIKSDVWSYGVTMWEVYSHGTKPYPDIKNFQMRSYLKQGLRLGKPPNCPPEIFDLMSQCWQKDPSDRPSFVLIVSKLEQFLLERTAASSVTTKQKFVTQQGATLERGLQKTPCKKEINEAEKKPSVKITIGDKAISPVYDVAYKDGTTAAACVEPRQQQVVMTDQAKAAAGIPVNATTYDDTCESTTSSSWDSVSSLSDESEGTAPPGGKSATAPKCPMLTPKSKLGSNTLQIQQNEENDYLQPVCNRSTNACSHGNQ